MRLGRLSAFLFCILFWSLSLTGQAKSQETLDFCFVVWEPFTKIDDTGMPAGLTIEIVTEAAKRAGYQATFTPLPWKRCLAFVTEKRFDAALDIIDRPGFIHGNQPTALHIEHFWARKGQPGSLFSTAEARKTASLVLMTGYHYPDEILNNSFSALTWVAEEKQAAKLVSTGRVDLTLAGFGVMAPLVKKYSFEIKPLLPPHAVHRLYPGFNSDAKEKMIRLDEAIRSLHDDGFVDRIHEKYLGISYTNQLRQFYSDK